MFEPTEKMKLAYRRVVEDGAWAPDGLADLAQHATAAALHLQFVIDHDFHHADGCMAVGHKYKDADWLKLADEKLREVKR